MRERGLMNLGFSGASRRSASESFWVGTFSTGTMGTFQPELTMRRAGTARRTKALNRFEGPAHKPVERSVQLWSLPACKSREDFRAARQRARGQGARGQGARGQGASGQSRAMGSCIDGNLGILGNTDSANYGLLWCVECPTPSLSVVAVKT